MSTSDGASFGGGEAGFETVGGSVGDLGALLIIAEMIRSETPDAFRDTSSPVALPEYQWLTD